MNDIAFPDLSGSGVGPLFPKHRHVSVIVDEASIQALRGIGWVSVGVFAYEKYARMRHVLVVTGPDGRVFGGDALYSNAVYALREIYNREYEKVGGE